MFMPIKNSILCCAEILILAQEACQSRWKRPPSIDRIHSREGEFRDSFDRERYFHGINSVEKGPPWYDARLVNDTHLIATYKAYGFNVVRLGIMWSGVQPASVDSYNVDYVDTIAGIVDSLSSVEIFTLFDMHQDVASSKYDTYDGFPRWLIDSFPAPRRKFPAPLNRVMVWQAGYLTVAVGEAFQALYDQPRPLVNFWKYVSRRFRTVKSILGYELINEPWAGDIYKYPQLLFPGIAGKTNLAPLYDHVTSGIRSVDNDTMIFYEPVTWAIASSTQNGGTGFKSPPGGDLRRTALSFHYYCWFYDPSVAEFVRLCDKLMLPKIMKTIDEDLNDMGGASSFLTEFGLCNITQANETVYKECEEILKEADRHRKSWTYWGEIPVEDPQFVYTFARIYAQAVAGHLVSGTYDVQTQSYNATIQLGANIEAPTEIVVPRVIYDNDSWFRVKLTSTVRMQWYYLDGVVIIQSCYLLDNGVLINILIHSI